MQCPACRQDNPAQAKFCLQCGQRLPAVCPACGHELVPGGKFCVECGAAVAGATRAPASPPAPAPDSYTPRHLAEKILASRSAVEGERKPVTVLFCDVVSSTALAGDLGAEGMHGLLNRFFELALGEVHRYEGTINQFLGDGFMALFGAPIAHEDHARRAVLCALGLVRTVEEHRFEVEAGRSVTVQLRLGLHTGFVVVGAIGDNLRMDYTAVGDTTHLAARLQQLAEPGAIVVSDVTARLVHGYVRLDALGATPIRGRAAPIDVFRVTGPGTRRSPLEAIEDRPLSPFVGRDREVGVLADLFREVEAGRGQTVGVVGEPGVGKSRLLLEFQRRIADRPGVYREGRCLSFGSAIPYAPVLDLVRAGAGIVEGDLPETAMDKVRVALADAEMDVAASAPVLAHLLGLEDGTEQLAGLTPEAIKLRTFETLRQMSVNEGRRRPLVLVIEDLHWVDRTSEEYLASLIESLAGAPILLVTTYRPGYRPPWMDRSYATQLSITRLGVAESLSVVRSVLPEVSLADPLAALILDKAEGNPFFLEELARAVGHPGAAAPGLAVPDTVHGMLTARIDRLADVPKRVLQTASILGREFSLRLLDAVWDGGGLAEHVQELVRQEFLYERAGAGERTYVFKHALTQDVAMSTVLAARRRELHLRAAEALAARSPDRLRELAPLLAHHSYAAEAWPLACEYATRAAEAASAAYANREALERYDQAVGAAERAGLSAIERLRLRVARAQVHAVLGAFEPARADLETALALADGVEVGADAVRAGVLGALAGLWGGHKDYTRALELAREAEASAERSRDRQVLAEAVMQRALMQLNVGALGESRRGLERAIDLFQEVADARGHARALDVLAMVNGLAGRVRACGEYVTDALRRFRALGERAPEPSLITNHGFWLVWAGERAKAEPLMRDGLQAALALGARSAEAYAHMVLAETNEVYGDFAAALREAGEALAIARGIGHLEWTAGTLSVLGRLHRLCGDPAGAAVRHEEMLAIDRALGSVLWTAEALGELGLDALESGDTERAAGLLDEAVATAPEAMKSILRYLIARAELALGRGDAATALDRARDIQARVPEFRVFIVEACRVEGEALVALGQAAAGEATLRRAKGAADAMAAAPATWRACLALASCLEHAGRRAEADAERAEARAALERAARDLPDALAIAFAQSAVMRRARGDDGAAALE